MRSLAVPLCGVCGERLSRGEEILAEGGDAVCGICRESPPAFEMASAYGSYDCGLRELVHLLKYDKVLPAANVLGRMLANAIGKLSSNFAAKEVVVVPVPLYPRKRRERGFNQAEVIARAALKFCGPKGKFILRPHLLQRRRITQSQIGLSQHQRKVNLRGAFKVPRPEMLLGREVLLVDDVLTTGTTVSECARVLLRAGASKVFVATVARTLRTNKGTGTLVNFVSEVA